MSWLSMYALVAALIYAAVQAQTHSACDPTKQAGCPADPALATSEAWDFTKSSYADSWNVTGGGLPTFDSNGVSFTVAKSGDSPTLISNFYLMFGTIDVVMKVAPGQGIVSAFVMLSDDLDEIDLEWVGGDSSHLQTNYFFKGAEPAGATTGAVVANPNCETTFQKYSLEWTSDHITWSINGNPVRTVTAAATQNQIPQTPSQIKLGVWSGGDPGNAAGTIAWAGGPTNYGAGPYSMTVQSVAATDFSTGTTYTYGDQSGTWQSIKSEGGQINGEETGSTPTSATTASPDSSSTSASSSSSSGTATSSSPASSGTSTTSPSSSGTGTSSSASGSANSTSSSPSSSGTGASASGSSSSSSSSNSTSSPPSAGTSTSPSNSLSTGGTIPTTGANSSSPVSSGSGSGGASGSLAASPVVTYTTQVLTSFTTFCPAATTFTYNSQTYTVSSATTVTVTNCPCTITSPVTLSTTTATTPAQVSPAQSSPQSTVLPLVPIGTLLGQTTYAQVTYSTAVFAVNPSVPSVVSSQASASAVVTSAPLATSSAAGVAGTSPVGSNITASGTPSQVAQSAASSIYGTRGLWIAALGTMLLHAVFVL